MHVLHSLPPQPVLVDLFYGFPAAALGISICSTLWDPSLPIYSNMQKSLKTYKNNTYFPVHTCLTKVEATGERCCRKLIFMTLTIHMIYSVYAECTYSDHTYDSCIRMSFRQKNHSQFAFLKKQSIYEGIHSDFKTNTTRYYSKKLLKSRGGVFNLIHGLPDRRKRKA